MRRFNGAGLTVAGLLGALALAGCEGADAGVVGPLQPEALAAAATQVSPAELVASLGLEEGQQEEVRARVDALHAAMLALHESMPADAGSGMSPEQLAEAHRAMQGQVQEVHEQLESLMGSLTEEQQQRFVEHVHGRMEGNEDQVEGHGAALLHHLHKRGGHDLP
jgi:hypothetical protein